MGRVNVLVITGYGTNSHKETAHTARLAGADCAHIVHFSDIVSAKVRLADYDFLIFPGGFLDGDDLGAAHAASMRWRYLKDAQDTALLDHLKAFLDAGKLILGICNGFQLLVKLGVLPGFSGNDFVRQVSLGHNDSARYEDRWVTMRINPQSPCVFTRGLEFFMCPVRHGEGKIIPMDEACLQKLEQDNLITLQYVHPETREVTQEYPANPNGSPLAIAGLTNPTGRVLGLMPHPEAFHHVTNHPHWTRGALSPQISPPGTLLFVNAVKYLREL